MSRTKPIAVAEDMQPTRWFSGQRVRHTGSLDRGVVVAVDFAENLIQVDIGDGEPRLWWRMENVVEVQPVDGARELDRRIRELHPHEERHTLASVLPYCGWCGVRWPCPTVSALGEQE